MQVFLYYAEVILENTRRTEEITETLTSKYGVQFQYRTLVPQLSTVLIFDVYGEIDIDKFPVNFPLNAQAVAVDNGDGDQSEPDLLGNVNVAPRWCRIAEGVKPPKDFPVKDYRDILVVGDCVPCCAHTRKNKPCGNKTHDVSRFCWRHRPIK